MVKIKLKAGKSAVEQATSGGDWGDPPKPGLYHLKLEAVEQKDTKDGNGKYLSCRWRPVGIGREGTKLDEKLGSVFDNVSITSEAAEWVRARLALALGAKPNRAGNVELSIETDPAKPGTDIGKVCLGRVSRDEDLDGNYRPKIGWIGPLDATPESEDEDGFEDDEEEADSPFDEEEEEAVEDDELLTEEALAEMDNKELGGVAKDFDIDTKKYVKKGRGGKKIPDREGLINAILEAQGGEEEDEDDEPF